MTLVLVALFTMKLSGPDQELCGPPAIQVFVRALFLQTGMTEQQTVSILGLQNTIPLSMAFTVSNSTSTYPLQPSYRITLYYRQDQSSREIRHILSKLSIGKVPNEARRRRAR
jgi:hypothetical protein